MAKTIQDYAVPFAAWDVRLFLDTHPTDKQALAAYRHYCTQCGCADNYACLPECYYSCDCWHWIDNPWPWELEANCPVKCSAASDRCNTNRYPPNQCQRRGN